MKFIDIVNDEVGGVLARFEMTDDSMDDGTKKAIVKGDILSCRGSGYLKNCHNLNRNAVFIVGVGQFNFIGKINREQGSKTILLQKFNKTFHEEKIEISIFNTFLIVEFITRKL